MANLEDLLELINFEKEDLEKVQDALDNLIGTINRNAQKGELPHGYNFFKYGSVSRKTKIKPLDDVDLLYVIGDAEKQNYEDRNLITKCPFNFTIEDHEPYTNISSKYLLDKIKGEIKKTYTRSEISRHNEVVNVYLSSYEVGFDITPAFYITNMDYYLIPEGSNSHFWKRTNPFKGEEIFNRINLEQKGQLRNVIKIIKYWFEKKKIKSPYSYHLECVLCYAFDESKYIYDKLINALYFAFCNINYKNYLKSCPDPSKIGENLTTDLDDDDIKKILIEAENAYSILYNEGGQKFVEYLEPDLIL